jgi:membrane-associated phospholipid phosphatase
MAEGKSADGSTQLRGARVMARIAEGLAMVKRFSVLVRIWLLSLVACAAAVAASFAEIDVPVARHFWRIGRHLGYLGTLFNGAVILTLESAVVLALILARVVRGHLSRFAETLGLACLASICAYAINDAVLKAFFGVQAPAAVLHGARHVFFAMRLGDGSFPSGHMTLAGAFAGVFMRLYRSSIGPLTALLLVAAVLLVVGGWHFISDVIAGTFLGVSAGILAAEGWIAHVYGE